MSTSSDRAARIVTAFRGQTFSNEEEADRWLLRNCSPNIFESEEDEGWIATVPALPGCSAFGPTYEESRREACAAIEAWIIAAEKRPAGEA